MKRKTLTKGMLLTALICGSVYWGGTTVHAAELQEFTLDPMVVTAQRMETRDLDTPASVSVITAAEIEKTGATTVTEALRNVAGITDYAYSANGDDQGSSQSRILVRGFDKAAVVMLNGAPINIMNYGSVNSVPVEAIERIEVVKGANSVLYGAEALSGVINIITKKGTGKQKTAVSGTVGNYLDKWNVTTQGTGYLLSLGKEYVDEFSPSQKVNLKKDGSYRYSKKYQKTNAFTSLELSPNLEFNWVHTESEPGYMTKNLSDGSQKGTRYDYEDKKDALNLIYHDDENKTKTIVSYNRKKVGSIGTTTAGKKSRSDSSNYEASNLYLNSQKQYDIGGNDIIIIGVDAKHENYDEEYSNIVDNSRNSYGLYVSYNKQFSDKFSTILGVRGQYYNSTDFDESYEEFVPQLQTLYKIDDSISWYTNIGKAFELPAVNAHAYYAGGTGFVVNEVKPQMGWNYETGFKRITNSTATKLAVYYMDFKNKFAWELIPEIDPVNKVQVNKGKFENTGVELEFKKNLSNKWAYNLGATYQDPKSYDEDAGKWEQESARLQCNAGIDYTVSKLTTNLNLLYLGDREDAYYNAQGKTKAPDHKLRDMVKLNATLQYRPTQNDILAFSMYNLLDRDNYVYEYEYCDLPFNWTLTYTHTF